MTATWKRFDYDSLIKTIPTGVDPFAYITRIFKEQFLPSSSEATAAILLVLLCFHSLVVLFCVFILIMSSIPGAKQVRWFLRALYIKDKAGKKVYNSPLYFVNAGILMTVMQLLSSASAQAYIWIQIKAAPRNNFALQKGLMIFLGPINMFETFCQWSMIHCLFVTLFSAYGFRPEGKTGKMRWISPPVFLNFLFIFFPICVAIGTAVTLIWMALKHNILIAKALGLMQGLRQGSFAWKELQDISRSSEEKAQIGTQLMTIISTLKENSNDLTPLLQTLLYAIRFSLSVLLVFVCITCVTFILVLCLLCQRYYLRRRSSDALTSSSSALFPHWNSRNSRQSGSDNVDSISIVRLNKQFHYLLLRAFGVFLSIITQIISLLICIVKTREIVVNKHWRGVLTWSAAICGAWSAVPIAFQCWRLYKDQTNTEFSSASSPSRNHLEADILQPEEPDIEIKLLAKPAHKDPQGSDGILDSWGSS